MADEYRDRYVAVEIGNRRLEGLTVDFTVSMKSRSASDSASITVLGLSDKSYQELQRRPTISRLIAGYEGRSGQLARGTTVPDTLAYTVQGGTTRCSWKIADQGYQLTESWLAESFEGSVRASALLQYVGDYIGAPLLPSDLPQDPLYVRNYTMSGGVRTVLDEIADDCLCRWSIQAGRLTLTPLVGPLRQRVVLISPDTGLVNDVQTLDGTRIRVQALLQPQLRPGDAFAVESRFASGEYIAEEVTHAGSSGEAVPFYTTIKARARRG